MSDLREEILGLIASEALIDRARLLPSATLADVGLDSVGVVSIVFAVEDKYGVEIGEEVLRDVSDVNGFVTVLETVVEARQVA